MKIALNGHFFIQMPHPTQSSSEIIGLPSDPITIVSSPVLTGGQKRWHSKAHFLLWHRSLLSTAILMSCLYDEIKARISCRKKYSPTDEPKRKCHKPQIEPVTRPKFLDVNPDSR